MTPNVLSQLEKEGIALTANRRLSIFLQRQFEQHQQQLGRQLWSTPQILPLNSWLTQTWQQLPNSAQLLLNELQEYTLWQQIIRQSKHQHPQLQIDATATLAQQAWHILQSWDIPLSKLKHQHNQETDLFLHWADQFQQQCRQKHCLSQACVPQQLLQQLSDIALPPTIYLLGFDEYPPIVAKLLANFRERADIETIELSIDHADAKQIRLIDKATEINTMARWAKQQSNRHPEHTLACIIPDLADNRAQVTEIFTDVFGQQVFDISAGRPFNQYPLIRIALQLLSVAQGPLITEQLYQLLQSPYLHQHPSDRSVGALADAAAREYNEPELQRQHLLHLFTQLQPRYPKATWLTRWQKFNRSCTHVADNKTAAQWATQWSQWLHIIGWPGHRDLDSEEYQLLQRWQQALDEFAQLDSVSTQLSMPQAMTLFQHHLTRIIFQPQSPAANVQVLGTLEASGSRFDQLWLMGLDDQSWPSAARPNPFIPLSMQIATQMPHCSSARELAYAERLTQRFLHSADQVIISSPCQQADQALRPSQLISALPLISLEALALDEPNPSLVKRRLDDLVEDPAPAVSKQEPIYGGSSILKQQALCPFRAFANIRLQARPLQHPSIALPASERGAITHEVLELIWEQLKDQDTLLKMDAATQTQLINTTVNTVIDTAKQRQSASKQSFLVLEAIRLKQLLHNWLELERKRPPFKVIANEAKQILQVGQLSLNVRIDRIDQLGDGSHLIIDYKTGLTNIGSWFGERPQDPQLPLYCSFGDNNQHNTAITFAEIRSSKVTFKGLISEQQETFSFPGIKAINQIPQAEHHTWQQLRDHWRQQLTHLSDEFCQGHAAVQPLAHNTCDYCELHHLCRI